MFKPYFGQGSKLNDLKNPIYNLQKQRPKWLLSYKKKYAQDKVCIIHLILFS
jgi:hypothetical protein